MDRFPEMGFHPTRSGPISRKDDGSKHAQGHWTALKVKWLCILRPSNDSLLTVEWQLGVHYEFSQYGLKNCKEEGEVLHSEI